MTATATRLPDQFSLDLPHGTLAMAVIESTDDGTRLVHYTEPHGGTPLSHAEAARLLRGLADHLHTQDGNRPMVRESTR